MSGYDPAVVDEFLERAKNVFESDGRDLTSSDIRAKVAEVMIPAYRAGEVGKAINGDWGSATVTEKDVFDIDPAALPAKFFKKVPDETRIRKTFQLEGVAPKGTVRSVKYGIMLKFKKES
jgi:hypothetical protein